MKIKIVDKKSQAILFNSYFDNMESLELAYNKAKEFEQMGLDIEMVLPTSSQSLQESLGYSQLKNDMPDVHDIREYRRTSCIK